MYESSEAEPKWHNMVKIHPKENIVLDFLEKYKYEIPYFSFQMT